MCVCVCVYDLLIDVFLKFSLKKKMLASTDQ